MSHHSAGPGLQISAPPELIRAIAAAVADELERRGASTASTSPYLDVVEAAEYLRCKPQRLYDLVSADAIKAVRDGRRLLFRRSDLDTYIQAQP